MSSANLDLLRSIFANWERGDFSSFEWAHPEIEVVVADGPEPGARRGRAELEQGMLEFLGNWEQGYRSVADAYRELDDGRVLVLIHSSGRGKASGLELGGQLRTRGGALLIDIRDGKVTGAILYFDRDRVLADLGLAPEGDASGPPD